MGVGTGEKENTAQRFICWGCDKEKAVAGNIYCGDCKKKLKNRNNK